MNAVDIRPVQSNQVAATLDYVMAARASIFPQLDATQVPDDLARFAEVYLGSAQGCFLLAWQAGQIVGSIGYLPYDQRFNQLQLPLEATVEVVRLFVSPSCRGAGVAKALYAALLAQARAAGVRTLYLHTHPFLPGAIAFWQKQGFEVLDVESDPVWQTTHMRCAASG
ncbi:GNAT family N-acetyltransferase [Pseudomonas sp. CFBP 13710]|uniref:GNAT family N-acetyltransferase n=1 Tax=Pseudomonas sp. CFBP 13710 TaxID=2775311 RepID=UPI001780B071|nr:GNAT family N-acetyltransferase [Pseudomonas sp. CFBP 13710]MBD8730189.1 GNAT family N-acetyltransferase [Pseudomonas sp. CFBP 13710]